MIMSRIEQDSPSLLSSQKTLTMGQEASLGRAPTYDSRNRGAFAPGPRKTKVPDSPPTQAHATNGNLLTQPGYTPRILPGGAGILSGPSILLPANRWAPHLPPQSRGHFRAKSASNEEQLSATPAASHALMPNPLLLAGARASPQGLGNTLDGLSPGPQV